MRYFIIVLVLAAFFIGCGDSKHFIANGTQGYKPNLTLHKNKTFVFKVNLCQGIGTIKGNYTKKGKKLILHVKERDFSGFSGDKIQNFILYIVDNKKLKFMDNADVGCGPRKGEIFTVNQK